MRSLLAVFLVLVCFMDHSDGTFTDFMDNLPSEIASAFNIAWSSMLDAIKTPVKIKRLGSGGRASTTVSNSTNTTDSNSTNTTDSNSTNTTASNPTNTTASNPTNTTDKLKSTPATATKATTIEVETVRSREGRRRSFEKSIEIDFELSTTRIARKLIIPHLQAPPTIITVGRRRYILQDHD